MNILLIFIPCIAFTNAQFFQGDIVRFEIYDVQNCKKDSPWTWSQDVRIINETHILVTASAELTSDLDNKITITGDLKKQRKNNEWISQMKLSKKNGCAMLKSLGGPIFIEVCKEIGRPNANCPIPKGKYSVENKILDYSQTPLARLIDGHFKVNINGVNQQKIMLFCIEAEFAAIKRNL